MPIVSFSANHCLSYVSTELSSRKVESQYVLNIWMVKITLSIVNLSIVAIKLGDVIQYTQEYNIAQ